MQEKIFWYKGVQLKECEVKGCNELVEDKRNNSFELLLCEKHCKIFRGGL